MNNKKFQYKIIHYRYLKNHEKPVSMNYYRMFYRDAKRSNEPLPQLEINGGFTVCFLTDTETGYEYSAIAQCSREDRFERRKGVERAISMVHKERQKPKLLKELLNR